MTRAFDEPDALDGSIAESAELGSGRAWAAFTIRPGARWDTGAPITAEDVVFTFEAVKKDGHPLYQLVLHDLLEVVAEGPHRVVFRFAEPESRRALPLIVASLPIM